MKKMGTVSILVMLLFYQAAISQGEFFAMWCRAPIPIYSDGSSTITEFTPNPVAAGPVGRAVEPGKCAWVDRPLRSSEVPRIIFDDWPVRAHQLLVVSAVTDGRRLQFSVRNTGGEFESRKSIYVRP